MDHANPRQARIPVGPREAEKMARKRRSTCCRRRRAHRRHAAICRRPRKGIRTGIVAEAGGQVTWTMGIENFISVPYTEGSKLVAPLEQHVKEYDNDVMNLQRARAPAS